MTYSRRRFLAASTAALASLAAGIPRAAHAKGSSRRLGVALLGLGNYSASQLAPALTMTRHCTLRGVVTGTPEKVPVWQRKYGIEDGHVYDYSSLPRVANDDAIDVVYIVVPTGLHAKYAIMAAEAGKHVWCEKPMAMDVKECRAIIDACTKNRVKLSIGYRMQHEPNTQTLMRYAKQKPYGALSELRALAGHTGGASGWRLKRALGGGALYDMGVYSINGIRYASGEEPVRVHTAKQHTKHPDVFDEVDETTEFGLELPSGVVAYGRTSVSEPINQLRVVCKRGWYELRPMQSYSGVRGTTSDGKKLELPIDNQQARQMDDDARAILEDRPVLVPGEEGLRDIRIVQAIQRAVAAKTSIAIES